jgi:hypothetical protein
VNVPQDKPLSVEEAVGLLTTWQAMHTQLAALREQEMALRKRIWGPLFPNPVEGTNKFALGNGYQLVGKYPIDRKVDEGLLQVLKPKLAEANIMVDAVVQYKPEFKKAVYNTFTEEQKHLFDQCLIVKPGSISFEVVAPKEPKK